MLLYALSSSSYSSGAAFNCLIDKNLQPIGAATVAILVPAPRDIPQEIAQQLST